jgi:hypothetical protein
MNLRKRIHEIESRAGIAIAAVTRTRGGHLRLTLPCGRFIVASSTPSDHRTISNVACRIRRTQLLGGRHAQ